MLIPFVGRLNPASGKEGLLPECCRGNLFAKQTAQKLSKKTRTNIGLSDFENRADVHFFPTENYFYNRLWSSISDCEWPEWEKAVISQHHIQPHWLEMQDATQAGSSYSEASCCCAVQLPQSIQGSISLFCSLFTPNWKERTQPVES